MGEVVRPDRRRADVEAREVKLGDALTILVPEPWEVERLEDGRWWCGDTASGESAIVDAAIARPCEGTPPDASPRQAAKAYLDHFRRFLDGVDGVTRIEVESTATGYILWSAGGYAEDDDSFRERRWYLFRGMTDGVMVLRMALHVREPVLDEQRFAGLAQLFDDQIRAAHGRVLEPDGREAEALQDFTMDGFVTLRLPLRWRCRQQGEDWYCFDPDGRPGRLWAGYDLFMPDGEATAEALAHQFAGSWEPVGSCLLDRKISPAPLGAVLQLIDEDADGRSDDCQDPPLRCYRWVYFALRVGAPGVMCRYTLMVPIAVADQPETQALIRLIGDEIQRQRLEETPVSWPGSTGGRPYGPRNVRNTSV
jgi:hypothetical protein